MNDLSSYRGDQSARAQTRAGFSDAHLDQPTRAAGAGGATFQRRTPSQRSEPGRSLFARLLGASLTSPNPASPSRPKAFWAKALAALLACAPVGTYAAMAEQAVGEEKLVPTTPAVPEPRQATSVS